jgi:hypothetical protein
MNLRPKKELFEEIAQIIDADLEVFRLSANFRKCPKMLWSWSVVEVVAG